MSARRCVRRIYVRTSRAGASGSTVNSPQSTLRFANAARWHADGTVRCNQPFFSARSAFSAVNSKAIEQHLPRFDRTERAP